MTKSRLESKHQGLLITFEGPEGSGKSTLIKSLADELATRGCEAMLTREPGGTNLGERIRDILLDLSSKDMCAETELLLMEASRAQLVREKIQPALEAGLIVLCDRFADATLAYQGYGRGLSSELITGLNSEATFGRMPDLTILLDFDDVKKGLSRAVDRNEKEGTDGVEDRFEE